MEDLTPDAVISIHDSIIAREGGDGRILSEGNLHQLVFHANLEGDAFRRAAIAFCFLCAYPVFRAGNRRTAVRIAETVLAGAGVPAKRCGGWPGRSMRSPSGPVR